MFLELGSDILSLLISAVDETGQLMSDAQLHDELITLLIAGYETTATVIAWALYWIHRHPQVVEKLLVELNHLGDSPDQQRLCSCRISQLFVNFIHFFQSASAISTVFGE